MAGPIDCHGIPSPAVAFAIDQKELRTKVQLILGTYDDMTQHHPLRYPSKGCGEFSVARHRQVWIIACPGQNF